MGETKKRNFLSRIKGKIKELAEKFNEMLGEEDYSELNAEQRKELEGIIAVEEAIRGGSDYKAQNDDRSIEEKLDEIQERIHGGKSSYKNAGTKKLNIEEQLNEFHKRIHGGNVDGKLAITRAEKQNRAKKQTKEIEQNELGD